MKLNISILGNCQLIPLFKELQKQDDLNITYASPYSNPEKISNFLQSIKFCDVFINTLTETKYWNNIALDTDSIIETLPVHTYRIIVPSIYFTGYFPTFGSYKEVDALAYSFDKQEFYLSKYHDYLMIILAKHKISYSHYIKLQNLQLNDILKKNIDKTFQELKQKEKKCCIQISNFLEQIYMTQIHFYTYNHPSNYILLYLYNQILQKIKKQLNIDLKIILNEENTLYNDDQSYVHNFIYHYLKLNHSKIMTNTIFNTIINYYRNKNITINLKSQPFINSMAILEHIL